MTDQPTTPHDATIKISPTPWEPGGRDIPLGIMDADGCCVLSDWISRGHLRRQTAETAIRASVAAVNSYAAHYTDPVQAAESDKLGDALAALREFTQRCGAVYRNPGKEDLWFDAAYNLAIAAIAGTKEQPDE